MSGFRSFSVPLLFLAILLCGRMVAASAEPEEPRSYGASQDNTGLISSRVMYEDTMLVAVTSDGVAAIVFGERIKDDEHIKGGIKYRFRFLKRGSKKEIVGEGSVFERYKDGNYDGGQLTIKAGAIRIGWSAGGDNVRGWVYYKPESMRLQIADGKRFEDNAVEDGDQVSLYEKLDLRRFLKQP
jgi:hypothetical protein